MWAAPLGCIASARTSPLNLVLSNGFRTTIRVLYGCWFAVPDTKYSFASYLKDDRPLPGGSDGVESNMLPGPSTGAEIAATDTATGFSGRLGSWGGPPPRCPEMPGGTIAPAVTTMAATTILMVERQVVFICCSRKGCLVPGHQNAIDDLPE